MLVKSIAKFTLFALASADLGKAFETTEGATYNGSVTPPCLSECQWRAGHIDLRKSQEAFESGKREILSAFQAKRCCEERNKLFQIGLADLNRALDLLSLEKSLLPPKNAISENPQIDLAAKVLAIVAELEDPASAVEKAGEGTPCGCSCRNPCGPPPQPGRPRCDERAACHYLEAGVCLYEQLFKAYEGLLTNPCCQLRCLKAERAVNEIKKVINEAVFAIEQAVSPCIMLCDQVKPPCPCRPCRGAY